MFERDCADVILRYCIGEGIEILVLKDGIVWYRLIATVFSLHSKCPSIPDEVVLELCMLLPDKVCFPDG